jgi:hypothetical protein
MPNLRDILLLCKPIAERRTDVICVDRFLLFVPLRSFFAGIYFARSGDKHDLEPRPMVTPLCDVRWGFPHSSESPYFRPGTRTWRQARPDYGWIYKDRFDEIKPERWFMTDPDYPDAIRIALQIEMLPKVAALATWEKALEFVTRHHQFQGRDYTRLALSSVIAQGDFARAKEILDNVWLNAERVWHINQHDPGLGDRLIEQGENLSMADKQALIATLHHYEAAAIKAMKLEKHWIPTPFPAEEKGLA